LQRGPQNAIDARHQIVTAPTEAGEVEARFVLGKHNCERAGTGTGVVRDRFVRDRSSVISIMVQLPI
jgi:hypothetical protein